MEDFNRYVIDVMKKAFAEYKCTGVADASSLMEAQKRIAFEIDRRKVGNLPCDKLEALYGDVTWLKCDLLGV